MIMKYFDVVQFLRKFVRIIANVMPRSVFTAVCTELNKNTTFLRTV